MSNKIRNLFRLKGMVFEKNHSEYKFINESNEQTLCSISLPEDISLENSFIKKNFKIVLSGNKKSKLLKSKVVFLSNFLKINLRLKEKLFVRRILLKGTGFKVYNSKQNRNEEVLLKIGFSHLIKVNIPSKISFKILKMNEIKFWSYDKELLGSFLNYFASMRFPDSYKGRGLVISNKKKIKLKKGKIKN